MATSYPFTTIDRLDRPSAYFVGKVGLFHLNINHSSSESQKKRRYNQEHNDESAQQKPQEDPLKDATTLYVGNL